MRRRLQCLIACTLLGALAGCGGGGGGLVAPQPSGPAEVEPNDSTPTSMGTLGSADLVVTGTTSSDADVDLFSFSILVPTTVLIQLDWNNANDLQVGITDLAGIMVRDVDTDTRPEACTVGPLAAGTYRVRVGSRSPGATAYSLRVGPR